ncbi:kinesin-like protein KIN-14C [Tanacetum coccineum]
MIDASMLEIYNENIQDLLAIKSNAAKDGAKQLPQYKISHDAEGNTYVSDLTIVDVCSIVQVSNLLQKAAHSRTDMNEESSWSHFVFILRIHGVNESTEQQLQGVLNLIDLAGSERLSRSGATGERLKERLKKSFIAKLLKGNELKMDTSNHLHQIDNQRGQQFQSKRPLA